VRLKYIAVLVAGCVSFSLYAKTTVNERTTADSDGVVEVSVVEGEIDLQGWDKNEVEVTGTLAENVEELILDSNGSHTLIKVVYIRNKKAHSDEETKLVINIPQQSELNVHVVSADVKVAGVYGEQRLTGVSSDISTQVFEKELTVQVVSGDMRVTGVGKSTRIHLTSVSGDIVASKIMGELEFATVSGDLVLEATEMARVRAKSTNGDISIHSDIAGHGRLDVQTINGDVEVAIAAIDGLSVNIETMNGDIDNCFGQSAKRKHKYGPGNSLRFNNGDGSRKVSVDTLNGDVNICL